MRRIKKIEKILKELKEAQDMYLEELRGIIMRKLITCAKCGKKIPLADWTFIQRMHYVYPREGAERNYWKRCRTEICRIACPRCGSKQYLYNHPQRDKIVSLIEEHPFDKDELFREVKEK